MASIRQQTTIVGAVLFAGMSNAIASPALDSVELKLSGPASIVFDSAKDGCEPDDTPDIPTRAIRDETGRVMMFSLYFQNRAFRGPDLAHVKLDCHVALTSPLDPDPAHYGDRNFIGALWSDDGRTVSALVHHEYHADHFNRCSAVGDLACWYNTITSYTSLDGGRDFSPATKAVVAAAPFRQNVEQGRHRGFFAPSNIVSDGRYKYTFLSTTGWSSQPFGACLFRTATPEKPKTWRAFDGRAFSIHYADPYTVDAAAPAACQPIAPFGFPVGGVVRQRGSDVWIAVFAASRNTTLFPVDGFYYATAHDLLHWSAPKLLLGGQTIMSDLCKGETVIGYPSILDDDSKTRNFQDVGRSAYLYFMRAQVETCGTGRRVLLRQEIDIEPRETPHAEGLAPTTR